VCERATIGFGWTADWMKKWREFFMPAVLLSDTEPINFENGFIIMYFLARLLCKNVIRVYYLL